MKALDTNVLLRLLVGDNARQQEIAQQVVCEPTLLTPTVLIETGWVLRARFGFTREAIVAFFETVFEYDAVVVENETRIRWAIERYADRGDLADLIHVASCGDVDAFVTFDRGVAPAANPDSPVPIETLA